LYGASDPLELNSQEGFESGGERRRAWYFNMPDPKELQITN